MAKRKRLSPAGMIGLHTPSETAPTARPLQAPIAHVAGEAATAAALTDIADELIAAREEGRFIQKLSLATIKTDHLVRDRTALNPDDMAALKQSLQERGQQSPIDVVALGEDSYGLISGFRRLLAFQEIYAETSSEAFAQIRAIIRPAMDVTDSYVSMVEENEIRANLSFYERARLASEAARIGVYPNARHAVSHLFANASGSKRSKILAFLRIHYALNDHLRFPEALPEKLGLSLSKRLEKDSKFASHVGARLRKGAPKSASDERSILDAALNGAPTSKKSQAPLPQRAEIRIVREAGRVVLEGPGVTPALMQKLEKWLAKN